MADAMVKEGFTITYRTVARYKEKDWAEPVNKIKLKPTKQAAVSVKNIVKAQVSSNPDLAHRILTAVEPTVDVRIARVQELALKSLQANQNPEMIKKVTERWELSDNLGQMSGTLTVRRLSGLN